MLAPENEPVWIYRQIWFFPVSGTVFSGIPLSFITYKLFFSQPVYPAYQYWNTCITYVWWETTHPSTS